MYCCMSPRSRETYLPPGVAPLIPLGQRKYRTVRFSSETEIVQEEKTRFQTGTAIFSFSEYAQFNWPFSLVMRMIIKGPEENLMFTTVR